MEKNMKLSQQISITPPAYTDHNNQIVTPPPIVLDELKVIYCDDQSNNTYYAVIEKIPTPVVLFAAEAYKDAGLLNKEIGAQKLSQNLTDDPAKFLRSLFPKTIEEHPNGPGTMLSKMIKTLGIVMTQGCSCRRHAIEMNEKGNDWCEQNVDTIVGWLREEATKRKLPFFDAIGKIMVNRAIKKSRRLLANESVPENDEELDNL